MSLPGGYQTWEIVLLVLLIAIGILAFIMSYGDLFGQAEAKVSFPNDKNVSTGASGTASFSTLGVDAADTADTIVYKLFKNFDPSFLSEKSGNTIYYNSFIINLKGKSYSYSDLKVEIEKGLNDFRSPIYSIGTSTISCGLSQQSNLINYNNDCWSSSLDSKPNPCAIYHSSGTLSNNARIKIVWYLDGKTGGKDKVDVIVTMCGG
jgi:hypothetical protein